jgi:hypothetical protein
VVLERRHPIEERRRRLALETGDQHVLARGRELRGDRDELIGRLPAPEDDLRKARADLAVEIRLGEAEVGERQIAERRERLGDGRLAALHSRQELLEHAPVHRQGV